MLRFWQDAGILLHVAVCACSYALALAHSLWWIALAVFVAAHLASAQHNHVHVPVFKRPALNRVLDWCFHVLGGVPSTFWRVHHVDRHHRSTWTERDWSSPFTFAKACSPEKPVGYRYYVFAYLPLFHCESAAHILRRRDTRRLRELAWSFAVFTAAHLLLSQHFGALRWAAVVGPSYVMVGVLLGAANYVQHWCVADGGERFLSRTFTCRLHNALNYNVGYHTLHHQRPGLHWSKLKNLYLDHAAAFDGRLDLVETGLYPSYRGSRGLRAWFEQTRTQAARARACVRPLPHITASCTNRETCPAMEEIKR